MQIRKQIWNQDAWNQFNRRDKAVFYTSVSIAIYCVVRTVRSLWADYQISQVLNELATRLEAEKARSEASEDANEVWRSFTEGRTLLDPSFEPSEDPYEAFAQGEAFGAAIAAQPDEPPF
jgi:hypothetical protein